MPRAVILTALPVEYLAVRAHLTELQEEMHPQGTIYERGRFSTDNQAWEVGIAEVGAGNAGAAVEAERAIAYFKPDVLLFVGIAGGIKGVAIGDVVAATNVLGYESGKVESQFLTRPTVGQSTYALVQRAKSEKRKGDWLHRLSNKSESQPSVFVAPIAAGEKVIASRESDLYQFLRSSCNNAIAVEMEGFGFLSAAFAYPNIQSIVIRGISDLIEDKNTVDPKQGTEEERQERASRHASAFAFEVLAKYTVEHSSSIGTTASQSSSPSPQATPLSLNLPDSAQNIDLEAAPPKVFISYSHDSQEHKDRVLELADRLRHDGIDAYIDQYEEAPAEGWQRWMLDQVEVSDSVLIICTEQYNYCFRGHEETGVGQGVTWEGGVIIQELYEAQGQNSKFIPVIFTSQDTDFIPKPLRGSTTYCLNSSNGYQLLYRRLTNQHATPKPKLGSIESLPRRNRQQFFLSEDSHSSLKEVLFNASKGLLNWKRTLGNDQYISRPELEQLQNRIATANSSTTIVLGAPGAGKSALMATLGHWAVEEKYALLAIKADYLSETVNTIEDLQHDIQISRQPGEAIKAIANTEKIILLIDQLDAISELLDRKSQRLILLLALIQGLSRIKNVHIIATCREFEFRYGSQFARLAEIEQMPLSLPPWEKISPILKTAGHEPDKMGESLRELLQTPLHLNIFLDIAQPGELFTSSQNLLDRLWEERVLKQLKPEQCVAFLEGLAHRMTEDEVLWIPQAFIDNNLGVWQVLEQAGLLTSNPANSTVGFRHQTYYDHTLARALARGTQSLTELVLERQDGLFVRPILLRGLNYLRGTALPQYQRQITNLLQTHQEQVRPHIRSLLFEFVGAQREPNSAEAELMIPLLNSESEGIKVLDAMVGSLGWFKRLCHRPEFTQWLKKPVEQALYCSHLLSVATNFASEDVWQLLEYYWLEEPIYDSLSLRIIWSINDWTPERVCLVQQLIQRNNVDWHTVAAIAEKIAETLPEQSTKVIRAHLDYLLAQAIEASQVESPELPASAGETERALHAYRYNPLGPLINLLDNESRFYEIEKFAEAQPRGFLENVWPWFLELIQKLAYEERGYTVSYLQDQIGDFKFFRSEIIQALLKAITELAKQNQIHFIEFLKQNENSDFLMVHRLLAHGLEIIAKDEPASILDYLLADNRRLNIGGRLSSDRATETEDLITAVFPYLQQNSREELERAIDQFSCWLPDKIEDIEFRRRCLQYNREHRLSLLCAIPEEYRRPHLQRLIEEEKRALPWFDLRRKSNFMESGFIGPRMTKDEMSRASDEHLLNLFNELSDQTEWDHPRGRFSNGLSRSGGAVQQSRAFGELVKDDPERFLRLLPQLQPQKHESYAGDAVEDLAETDFPANELIQIIEELDQRGFISESFRSDAASALEKIAKRSQGLPKSSLHLLQRWLPDHSQPALEHHRSTELRHRNLRSPILFRMSSSHTLPHGRGNIVRAIAEGYLNQEPPDREGWANFIRSQLGKEPHPAVWVDILQRMPSLLNGDRKEATALFDQVIRNCPEVLQYSWALYFIAHAIGWFDPQETVQAWLEILEEYPSDFSRQAYGELLLIQYLQYQDEWSKGRIYQHLNSQRNEAIPEWCRKLLKALICRESHGNSRRGDLPHANVFMRFQRQLLSIAASHLRHVRVFYATKEAILCGLAHAASNLCSQRGCRQISADILRVLASSSNEPIQYAVASVFRWNRDNFRLDSGMAQVIQAVCQNQNVLLESANDLVEIIEEERLIESSPQIVAEVCSSLLGIGAELANPARPTALVAESLTTLAIQLHRQGAYREVGLQLFEKLLTLNLRETQLALETLDRRPGKSTSPFRPRVRRRWRKNA